MAADREVRFAPDAAFVTAVARQIQADRMTAPLTIPTPTQFSQEIAAGQERRAREWNAGLRDQSKADAVLLLDMLRFRSCPASDREPPGDAPAAGAAWWRDLNGHLSELVGTERLALEEDREVSRSAGMAERPIGDLTPADLEVWITRRQHAEALASHRRQVEHLLGMIRRHGYEREGS